MKLNCPCTPTVKCTLHTIHSKNIFIASNPQNSIQHIISEYNSNIKRKIYIAWASVTAITSFFYVMSVINP